jgi:hypothetical protein
MPPGLHDYSTVRLSRHALGRFVERLGSEAEQAEAELRQALMRTKRLGRNPRNGAIAVLALHGQRAFVAILQDNVCTTVLTWNQFVPSLSEFGRVKLPRRRGRMLDRLGRPHEVEDDRPSRGNSG